MDDTYKMMRCLKTMQSSIDSMLGQLPWITSKYTFKRDKMMYVHGSGNNGCLYYLRHGGSEKVSIPSDARYIGKASSHNNKIVEMTMDELFYMIVHSKEFLYALKDDVFTEFFTELGEIVERLKVSATADLL
jgi:hypothetical protein